MDGEAGLSIRWPPPTLWGVVLGAVGLCTGFYAPIVLNPDANQGPLFGIFITGPAGFLGGILLGRLVLHLPITSGRRWLFLLAASVLYLLGVLYASLPPPETHGYLIEGRIDRCQAPAELVPEGIAYWEGRIAGAPWMEVRGGWQAELRELAAREPAVVLTVITRRENRVVRHRRPWNRGRIGTEGWQRKVEVERYLARFAGGSCSSYPGQLPVLFMPYAAASSAWPPEDLAGLLHVSRLEPATQR